MSLTSRIPLLFLVFLAVISASAATLPLRGSPKWLSSYLPTPSSSSSHSIASSQPHLDFQHETISGPPNPHNMTSWYIWITALIEYRHTALTALTYNSSIYDDPASTFIRRLFIQPQAMIHDRYLYNPDTGYTVDRYLDDVTERYGGIDAVLLWHSYPNIGVDSRNQFDMLRSLPGYPLQVKAAVERFHARGVRVLLPFNPWDTGTNLTSPSAMAELIDGIALLGVDGFNGDTMTGIPREFFQYARTHYNLTLMLQAEGGLSDTPDSLELPWQMASWGYWAADPTLVSKYKWLEPRHFINVCNRWGTDHRVDLQQAWLNGIGFESWEDVWSIWNGLTARDAERVRRVGAMSRHLWYILTQPDLYMPHFPVTVQPSVYAFLYAHFDGEHVLYSIINTSDRNLTGVQLELENDATLWTFLDCYHGVQLHPTTTHIASHDSITGEVNANATQVAFDIEAGGFGCVLLMPTPQYNASLWQPFLQQMRAMTAQSLSSFSPERIYLQQQMVPTVKTPPASSPPANMTLIKGMAGWWFNVSGTEIEGGDGEGVDVQYDVFGEKFPQRHHSFLLTIPSFYVDTTSVTREQYSAYLTASKYQPSDPTNFLRQWTRASPTQWEYPAGTGEVPVTWVSIEEARAYCVWYDKRLIQEWEWSYVAQNGGQYSLYPFGSTFNASLVPPVTEGPNPLEPAGVNQYAGSASAMGVKDLVYNKWEWTSEARDEHSRRGVLRGGSRYRPQGSMWYLPNQGEGQVHGLLLLMGQGMDRSQFIGFRCVKDVASEEFVGMKRSRIREE